MSATTSYVIYDQYHWLTPDHLEVPASSWDEALSLYQFYKAAYPKESLGLCTLAEFQRKSGSIHSKFCSHCNA